MLDVHVTVKAVSGIRPEPHGTQELHPIFPEGRLKEHGMEKSILAVFMLFSTSQPLCFNLTHSKWQVQ